MTTSRLFSGGKWSSSFRIWSAKHCGNTKKGGIRRGREEDMEGEENSLCEWHHKSQRSPQTQELSLLRKKTPANCTVSLALVHHQNGSYRLQGPGEFDGKLLKLANGSLQMNALDPLPRGRHRAHFQMERKRRWEGGVVLRPLTCSVSRKTAYRVFLNLP